MVKEQCDKCHIEMLQADMVTVSGAQVFAIKPQVEGDVGVPHGGALVLHCCPNCGNTKMAVKDPKTLQ